MKSRSVLGVGVLDAVGLGARRLGKWRKFARKLGLKGAFVEYVREALDLEERLARIETRVSDTESIADRIAIVDEAVHRTASQLGAAQSRVDEINHRVSTLQGDSTRLFSARDALANKLQTVERSASLIRAIAETTRWSETSILGEEPLVSVVLATRGRPESLRRAVASVIAQTYSRWELLVVDDAGPGETPLDEATSSDPRIRRFRSDGRGVSAARNVALHEARGSLVAYVDDDNVMFPEWLKAVAWGFDSRPVVDVIYGARIMERTSEFADEPGPTIQFEPFDRLRLEHGNYVDLGVLAHRAGLPGARFDETLSACVDWDLLLRLTVEKAPYELPVLASAYSMARADRITLRDDPMDAVEAIRRRHAKVRVLAYNAMFPLITEQYISDEIDALVEQGATAAYFQRYRSACPMPVRLPLYDDLDVAVRDFRPDLVLIHWATFATQEIPTLERLGLPFGVRVHSFDFDLTAVRTLVEHPLCIGVWVYPHLRERAPGMLALPSLFTSIDSLPPPSSERNTVLTVAAGLPKRDWAFAMETFSRLPELDARIVVGTTNEFEHVPDDLARQLEAYETPPALQVNVQREEVFALLSRASVLLYPLKPETATVGNPMSVIEAAASGCLVLLPDREDARAFAGPVFEAYGDVESTVRRIREITRGGPEIDALRERNRAWARSQFGAIEHRRRFFGELVDGYRVWRIRREAHRRATIFED